MPATPSASAEGSARVEHIQTAVHHLVLVVWYRNTPIKTQLLARNTKVLVRPLRSLMLPDGAALADDSLTTEVLFEIGLVV